MAGDDDHVIENDVVRITPDLSGFRRKLEAELKRQLTGVKGEIPVELNENANREALNYVAGLRAKYIKEQLKQTRNGNEQVQKANQQANKAETERQLTHVRTLAEKLARARDQAGRADAERTLTQVRNLGEKVSKAQDQANRADAERNLAQVRTLAEKVAKAEVNARLTALTRENSRLRSQAEKNEKTFADAVLADRERTNTRVRNAEEGFERTRAQAQAANYDRERSRYRTHAEYLDSLHGQANAHELGRTRSFTETLARAQDQALRENVERNKRANDKIVRDNTAAQKTLKKTLFTGPKLIDYGGKGVKPLNLLLGVATLLSPALFALGSSAVQASTSLVALGSAGIGAALGLGGILTAFNGIGDALKLRKTVKNEALTDAANQKSALDDLASARRSLADAQRGEIEANRDVHDSRLEAIRDLQNLRQSVRDLNNEFKDDSLTLEEKKDQEGRTLRNVFATTLEKRRATQDRRNAETELSDTGLKRKQATDDLKTSVKKGVEGSDKVRAAKEKATDARDRVLDAQTAVKKAKAVTGSGAVSSAAAQLAAKRKELSKPANDILDYFDRNEKAFKDIQKGVSAKVLPGFLTFLEAIYPKKRRKGQSTLEVAARYAGDLGAIIGKYAGKIGEFTNSKLFRKSFATIQKNNADAFETFGQAALIFVKPVTRILAAASPGVGAFADKVKDLAARFDKFIAKADEDGSLAKWFRDARIEAKKWYDIAGNILDVLGDLFTGAIGSGTSGSLATKFEEFTQSLSDYTSSPQGQEAIKKLFGFFKDLPYAKIADFFIDATTFFAAFRTYGFLKSLNPFFLGIAGISAILPGGATTVMGALGTSLRFVGETLAKYPVLTGGLLTLLAAAKVSKTVGFDIKIPVVTSLRDALVSKFKVLDKFVGGGASTATMTVQAGVVNVYGGAGVPGLPSKGKPGKVPTAAGAAGAAGGGLAAGVTVAAIIGAVFADQGFKRGIADQSLTQPFKEFVQDPSWKTFVATLQLLSPVGIAAFAIGKAVPKTQKQEKKSFNNALVDAAQTVRSRVVNDPNVVKRDAVKNYIRDRKKSVDALVAQTKATEGQAAADKVQATETQKSADTLSLILQTYGYTKDKADAYAGAVTGLNEILYKQNQASLIANGSLDGTGKKIDDVGGKAKTAAGKMKVLADLLGKLDGTRTITIKINGYTIEVDKLENAVILQQLLRTGEAPTESKIKQYKTKFAQTNNLASGGKVTGYSPNTRADNIPAMLTANEYVHPVAAVKHYGTDFMEAVRTRQFPAQYADGGIVGGNQTWPFAIKMPDALGAVQSSTGAYGNVGGGVARGDVNVAELAESTARSMGATSKQLVALISAGIVESGLRNINYGDRDSVGFLQQRPSQGWGTVSQLTDPAYATRKFILAAKRIDNAKISAGELAARVQRPAAQYRGRYAEREADAVATLNRLAPFLDGYNAGGGLPAAFTGKVPKGLGKIANISGTMLAAAVDANRALGLRVSSGFRQGAVTSSGNDSYHSRNPSRAIDLIPPSLKAFNYLHDKYATVARELIYSPANQRQVKNGQPHYYTGSVRADHYDHMHLALANGGLVKPAKYDNGGVLPPGYSTVFNGTGKNETVRTDKQEKALGKNMRIDPRDLASLAAMFAGGASTPTVTMDGRRVAELTNRYNYMPAGV